MDSWGLISEYGMGVVAPKGPGIVRLWLDDLDADERLRRKRWVLLFLMQCWLWYWAFGVNIRMWRLSSRSKGFPSQKKLNRMVWKTCCHVGFNIFKTEGFK